MPHPPSRSPSRIVIVRIFTQLLSKTRTGEASSSAPFTDHVGSRERTHFTGRGQGPLQLPERHHWQPRHREAQLGPRLQRRIAIGRRLHEHCAGENGGVRRRQEAQGVRRCFRAGEQCHVHLGRLMSSAHLEYILLTPPHFVTYVPVLTAISMIHQKSVCRSPPTASSPRPPIYVLKP